MNTRGRTAGRRAHGAWHRIAVGVAGLTLYGLAAASWVSGQTILDRPARLEVEGVPLVDALRLLQERAPVPLVYSPELVPERQVSCDCGTRTVRQALEVLLRDTGLTFRATESRVLIQPRAEGDNGRGVVAGRVVGDETGGSVASVAVRLHTGQGVLADESGRFVLRNVPPGRHRLEVSGMGWESWADDVVVDSGDTVRVVARLRQRPVPLPEIVVAPGTFGILESVPPGTVRTITRDEIETMPQVGEDVFRSLTRLAGVTAHDISTRLSVRGSLDREVVVRLDGMELYEPYHLQDFDGVFGIVDLATLSGVELRAGGFGVEQGGGGGGLLDMRSRTAVGSPRSTASLNMSHLSLVSEGGFAEDKGSWLVSGREGSLGLLMRLVGADERLSPRFRDAFGKVAFQPAPGQLLAAHVLHAGDRFRVHVDEAEGGIAQDGVEGGDLRSDWTSTYGWITWSAQVGPRTSTRTQVEAGRLSRSRHGWIEDWGNVGSPEGIEVRDDRSFDVLGVREAVDIELTPDLMLRVGGEALRTWADYDYFAQSATPYLTSEGVGQLRLDTVNVAIRPQGDQSAAFLAARGRAGPLTAEVGARYERSTLPRESHVAPRAQASLSLTPSTTLKASMGRYYQSQGVGDLQAGDGQTLYSPAERSDLVALGLEHRIGDGAKLRVEAYDRRISDQQRRFIGLEQELSIFPEQQGDRLAIDPGRGRARGVELFAEGSAGGAWHWAAGYALSKAEDEIPQASACADGPTCLDDPWVPRRRDQRHAVNLQVDYRPSDRLHLAATWTYHSGWPMTEWTYGAELRADGYPFFTRAFGPLRAERLPAYHRLDFRATRTFTLGPRVLEAYVDLFNVYDRRNRGSYQYYLIYHGDGQVETVRADYSEELLPILPMVGLRFRF